MFDMNPKLPSMHRHLLALLACVALSACTPPKIGSESRADQDKINKSTEQMQELARREQKNPAFVVLEEGPRFGARSVNLRAESQLPARLNQVTIQLPGRHSLATVAAVLSRSLDLPVVMSPDALMDAAQFSPLTAGSAPTTTTSSTGSAADRASQAGARRLNISPSEALNSIELNYSGPVVTLLDQIAARAGLYWEYTGGRILFSRVVSRTFAIKSMSPGVKTTGSISLSSSGASGEGGGGESSGGLSIEANSETNVWANLEPTLLTMVSTTGRLQMDAPGGSVTVTDALDNVNRIERYVRQLNDSLLRQITLEVEVFQVNLNDDYSNGLSWNALAANLTRLNGGTGSVRISTPTPSSAASGGAFTLTTGSTAARTSVAVVSALESFGRVSGVYSGVVTTVNRTPVPLGSTTSQSYLRETTPAVVSGSNLTGFTTQAGLVPGTINTGFTMVVTPTILDSNRVLVQTSLEISNLVSLDKFGTDAQSIQLPNISRFVTMQRSNMMAGETLVLTGYERQSTQVDASDVVRGVLPSSRSGKRQRESLVILITPRLQDI